MYDTTMTQASYEHTCEGLAMPTGLSSPWVVCDYGGIIVLPSTSITVNTSMSVHSMTSFKGSTMRGRLGMYSVLFGLGKGVRDLNPLIL